MILDMLGAASGSRLTQAELCLLDLVEDGIVSRDSVDVVVWVQDRAGLLIAFKKQLQEESLQRRVRRRCCAS